MISFTVITSTPTVLRNQLIARNVIKQVTLPASEGGGTQLVGVFEGLEWVEVPNPIVTTLAIGNPRLDDGTPNPSYVPAVMDTRHCYLVKLVRDAEGNEEAGLTQSDTSVDGQGRTITTVRALLQRTKLGQWVLNNSVADTLTSADGRSWPARKVGTNFWLVASDDFGMWQ